MQICIVVNSFPDYTETFVFNKIVALVNKGHKVTVVCFQKGDYLQDIFDQFAIDQRQLKVLQIPRLRGFASILTAILKHPFLFLVSLKFTLRKTKKKFQYKVQASFFNSLRAKIIYLDSLAVGTYFLPCLDKIKAYKVLGCKSHQDTIDITSDEQAIKTLQQLLKKVDMVHCLATPIRNSLSNLTNQQYSYFIHPPAVDTDFFTPKPETSTEIFFKVLSVGRLSPEKGYLIGLLAVQKLLQKGIQVKWTIVGEGSYYKELKAHIANLNLKDHVILIGPRNFVEINALLNKADCLLHIHTGLVKISSGFVLEAMSKEVPVIVSDYFAIDGIVTDQVDGLIVPSYNIEGVVEKMLLLIENSELRKNIGIAGRKKAVQHFAMKNSADMYHKQYKMLV
ncbi:MAG: glycosyltransferase family 4 protein [Sphingobacteriia bacterium]|nr:glycosyltransferase family 4 protein [Sphingobacteriia bacterium]